MSKQEDSKKSETSQTEKGISKITVAGFKSISREQSIEIRPLTILAGANSSGKSSIMQSILLLKQTLEATYDPGPLLLNGPNVKFTSVDQLLSCVGKNECADGFHIGIEFESYPAVTTYYKRQKDGRLGIQKMILGEGQKTGLTLTPGMSHKRILAQILSLAKADEKPYEKIPLSAEPPYNWFVIRKRCFLEIGLRAGEENILSTSSATGNLGLSIRQLIHLPALRGNPERTFPVTAVGSSFPGTFQEYAASVIAQWQTSKNRKKLQQLSKDMQRLGLTWKATAKSVNDTQVELQVGRLPRAVKGGARDLVNIADVGFGVSQTLPVLVALIVAEPGQMVYVEEPETHLHPRAQSALAQILVDAANRGVRVVIETHSQLLLLGIQTLVAEGKISPDLVKLHWFKRNNDGATEITSADLDEAGAFGDRPEDFADVALRAESRYLDAAESQQIVN